MFDIIPEIGYLVILFSSVIVFLLIRYRLPFVMWVITLSCISIVLLLKASTSVEYSIAGLLVAVFMFTTGVTIPPVRRYFFTKKIFNFIKCQKIRISTLEQQALAAGEAGFESGYFTGRPDWETLHRLPALTLTETELAFLSGPIEDFCTQVDDWDIRSNRRIPENIWAFAKAHNFSGLRVHTNWGGAGFSFQAQSLILSKVASRSVDASILIELPTSLYPDEIIEAYGTEAQKKYYLPRLAQGEEIVAFAVTGTQGSDVGNMPDTGVVTYGIHEGTQVLGIKLNFKKRYITFAPQASLIVLAFSLTDPDQLLNTNNSGITLALIPANHPGVDTSKRHYPAGLAFPHGPISGKDVFIPLEWVIGDRAGIGYGWKMIVQCLFVGRCLALPSISVGTIKLAFLTTTAYAVVRRQFALSLQTFEGVQAEVAKLTELTYRAESARAVAAALVDSGKRPLAVSGIMKYKLTEYARQAVNHALDVHAGRGICDGPSNYLLSAYNAVPIGVTVEGANIVTRSVITFAQGALQSHPYLRKEIESCEDPHAATGLVTFDTTLSKHISLFLSNCAHSLSCNLTFGYLENIPKNIPPAVKKHYKQISRYSASFAVITDVTILLMGTTLKKQQRLGGRLSDILAELYLLSAVLKRYRDDGYPASDSKIVEMTIQNGLHTIEHDLRLAIQNFPHRFARMLLRFIIFPLGTWRVPANDNLSNDVAKLVLTPGETRDRLAKYSYHSSDPDDSTGRLEVALKLAVLAEPIYKKIRAATRAGVIAKQPHPENDAVRKNIISEEEAVVIKESEQAAAKAMAVDSFN